MRSAVFLILLLLSVSVSAQKVAYFSTGTIGKKDYEQYAFWNDYSISYTYGSSSKMLTLNFLGFTTFSGQKAFTVQFPNKNTYAIIPGNHFVQVWGITKQHYSALEWEYQGPIDGKGTYCEPCAQTEKAAIKFMRKYYTK